MGKIINSIVYCLHISTVLTVRAAPSSSQNSKLCAALFQVGTFPGLIDCSQAVERRGEVISKYTDCCLERVEPVLGRVLAECGPAPAVTTN